MFQLQPTLVGKLLRLRPLQADDYSLLYAAASDPRIWAQHPNSDRYKEEVFKSYFEGGIESGGALAIIDATTGDIIGSSRYSGLDEVESSVEIGWTFITTKYWGGLYNRELKQLMIDHAFKYVDNILFYIGPQNIRSRKAVEKLGAIHTGSCSRFGGDNVVYCLKKAEIK